MKRFFTVILVLLSIGTMVMAQSPLTYQFVVRDNAGKLVSESQVSIVCSIIEDSANGIVAYSEKHTPTTNANGLATIKVGAGTVVSGDFTLLDWSAHTYYFKTEIDPLGGNNYTEVDTRLIWKAPLANSAEEAFEAASVSYNNLLNQPNLFSGVYDSLSNKPVLFSGVYDSLTNKPALFD